MIETEQSITIDAPIADVWAYARDIDGWARLMPGLQECRIIDADESRWTLKVGAGALVRRVTVAVRVDRWAGPDEVDFSFALEGDPVKGGGTYRARSLTRRSTEVTLGVRVEGTGPMAPMWEAMGRPMLPKFARGFAEQFKAEIESGILVPEADAVVEPPPPGDAPPSFLARVLRRLRSWFAPRPAS